jgi:hypothetical protein
MKTRVLVLALVSLLGGTPACSTGEFIPDSGEEWPFVRAAFSTKTVTGLHDDLIKAGFVWTDEHCILPHREPNDPLAVFLTLYYKRGTDVKEIRATVVRLKKGKYKVSDSRIASGVD